MTADKAQPGGEPIPGSRDALHEGARDGRELHDRAARIFAEAQHRAAKSELDAIRSSAGWALVQKLYPLRFTLLPRGSRRESTAQWAVQRLLRRSARTARPEVPPPEAQSLTQPETTAWPKVSIVIVTCNNVALNELCLQTVLADTDYPDCEVIVVDNGSTDGTKALLQRVAATEPRLRLVLQPDNIGFARACNAGVSVASGDILCFLNNDTVVHGRWLRALVTHLSRDARLGLVGPTTNAIDNEACVDVGYLDLDGMRAWADAYCAARSGVLVPIRMLAFFCVVMPRAVWERVGPLDERFTVGMFEDDDYCRRVRAERFEIKVARDSFVHHFQGASFRMLGNDEYLRIRSENERKFRAKWT
jgi:GT2 family glycosyltransferase